MGTFRERFGLDYLKMAQTIASSSNSGAATQKIEPSSLPPGMEEALLAFGHRIARALDAAPDHTLKAFDLTQTIGVRIDVLFPIVEFLVTNEYVAKLNAEQSGNDTLKLTDKGSKLL